MNSNFLVKQIETYSNAIVAFFAVQGLTYLYYLGLSERFICLLKTRDYLAIGIVIGIIAGAIASIIAIRYLSDVLGSLSSANSTIVRKIYSAKWIVILFFASSQVVVTVFYVILSNSIPLEC